LSGVQRRQSENTKRQQEILKGRTFHPQILYVCIRKKVKLKEERQKEDLPFVSIVPGKVKKKWKENEGVIPKKTARVRGRLRFQEKNQTPSPPEPPKKPPPTELKTATIPIPQKDGRTNDQTKGGVSEQL